MFRINTTTVASPFHRALDSVMRSGVNDSGGKLNPTAQTRFREAAAWKPGEEIPDDWADL